MSRVILNVYDLNEMNDSTYQFGFGIYHNHHRHHQSTTTNSSNGNNLHQFNNTLPIEASCSRNTVAREVFDSAYRE